MSDSDNRENIFTPANIVTLTRICAIPLFVVAIAAPWPAWLFPDQAFAEQWKPWVAAGIFILLACTDALDGYLARSRNEVTNFGKLIDPLADKILVAAALISLVELQVLPSWIVLIILAREFIVSGIRMIAASQGDVIAASWYGKAKTVAQIIAIVMFILKDSIIPIELDAQLHSWFYWLCWLAMTIALVLTVLSMLDYFSKARHLFGFSNEKKREEGQRDCSDPDIPETSQSPCELTLYAERVIEAARGKGLRISTAESLTGGMIGSALTAIPGSSDVYAGSIVSYSNDVKRDVLGVSQEVLDSVGAVSGECACMMAAGASRKLCSEIAVSTTGIAGPTGAEPNKPIGTVWIGISSDGTAASSHHCFSGNRNQVREQSVHEALHALLKAIESY